MKKSLKLTRARLRLKILLALGGVCAKCACADLNALVIDHINGGGKKDYEDSRNCKWHYHKIILQRVLSGSKDYQVLCENCNRLKYKIQIGAIDLNKLNKGFRPKPYLGHFESLLLREENVRT